MPDFSKTQPVCVTLRQSTLQRVEDLKAQFEGANRSQMMNTLLTMGLDAYEQTLKNPK